MPQGVNLKDSKKNQTLFSMAMLLDRYSKNCIGQPGMIYNFNTQNLVFFEDNITYKSEIPLAAYIDFETTALTNFYLDPRYKETFAVSYVLVFAVQPHLNINCIIIERSFRFSLEKLTSIDYSTRK